MWFMTDLLGKKNNKTMGESLIVLEVLSSLRVEVMYSEKNNCFVFFTVYKKLEEGLLSHVTPQIGLVRK